MTSSPARFLSFQSGWSRGLFLVVLCSALVAGGLWWKNRGAKDALPLAISTSTPVTLEFTANDLASATAAPLPQRVSVSGSLQTPTQAVLKSRLAAQVVRVAVQEGEAVARGALLVELDAQDLRSRLDAAKADEEERRAKLALAQINRDSNRALKERGFISQNAADQTESAYLAAQAALRGAQAQTQLAQRALADARLLSPLTGTVARRYVNVGDRVTPESPVVQVVDLSRLDFEALAPVADVPRLAIGQAASFRVDGFGERIFRGRVERINPVTEPGTRMIRIHVAVPNPDGMLRGGMFASAQIDTGNTIVLPVIPATAVFEEAGQRYVFTIESGVLKKRAVQLGASDEANGLVAVAGGLSANVPVVRLRMNGLKDGAAAVVKAGAGVPAR